MHRVSRLTIVSWLVALVTGAGVREAHAATCTVPADCTALQAPVCNGGICAPCLADHAATGLPTDCPSADQPACQPSNSSIGGACTECAAGKTSRCDADHPVCLDDGTCGCNVDGDCGGRTCNLATHACTPTIVDAGSDGGGARDDAGIDAGSAEGGSVDGGSAGDDSGSDGGGLADSGNGDSGIVDAGADADASANADASTNADASASLDGGPPLDGAYIEGDGCDCRASHGSAPSGMALLAGIALASAVIRRRRSR